MASVTVTSVTLIGVLWLVDLKAVVETFARLQWSTLFVVVAALGCGAVMACCRFKLIARDIGYRISTRDAVVAVSLGQLAGNLFFQVVGQLIARSAILSRRGVPVSGTILLTGYERLSALIISLALACAGGWYLFGRITIDVQAGGAEFLKLAVGGTLALAAGAWLGWGRELVQHARANIGPAALSQAIRNLTLSLAIQLSTMAAYIVAAVYLEPTIAVIDIAAAAAVVMFAASIPISLAGWGVRELGAIYALGIVGLSTESAFVVAVLIGGVSVIVVGMLALGSALMRSREVTIVGTGSPPGLDPTAFLSWTVPIAATTGVFFQVHVPVGESRLNVNLADPTAIVGGALFLLGYLRSRSMPAWRVSGLGFHVASITAALCLSLIIGFERFGWTDWAVVNRFAGWFIVLAYAATGALLVRRAGLPGIEIMFLTFASVSIAIAAIDLGIFAAVALSMPVPAELISYRSQGFAQNANAFALQLLLALACTFAVVKDGPKKLILLAALLIGLWFTGSRSGLLSLCMVAASAVALRAVSARHLAVSVLLAATVICTIDWLPEIAGVIRYSLQLLGSVGTELWQTTSGGQGARGGESVLAIQGTEFSSLGVVASGYAESSVQRLESLRGGLTMFKENPLFGAGLGAFMDQYRRSHGVPLVIHSTPLWALAEMGIVGFTTLLVLFVRLLTHELRASGHDDPARIFLIVGLLAFAVVAIVHDMLYQRALWLLCGAALACVTDVTRAIAPRR